MADKAPRKVADHVFLNAEGEKVTDLAQAATYEYRSIADWTQNESGDWVPVYGEIHRYYFDDMPEATLKAGFAFGLKTKATNTASGVRNASTESDKTEDEALAELLDDLKRGVWTSSERGGGGSGLQIMAEAIARLKGTDNIDAVLTWLQGQSEEQREALAKDKAIKSAIGTIRAERRAAKGIEAGGIDLPDFG